MNEKEIIEGNKLIAEFMGLPLKRWVTQYNESERIDCTFKYHSSWNDLMPVVEKIESIDNNSPFIIRIVIDRKFCKIDFADFNVGQKLIKGEDKITATWLAVVEFIKWYNSNPPA